MPDIILPDTQEDIIAGILRDQRRRKNASAASRAYLWEFDKFTISGSSDTAHTLTYLPYGVNNVALNGVVLLQDGTDVSVNYTTGVVTLAAAPTAGDVLTVSYVTTGELKVLSGPVDYGSVGTPADFQIISNGATLGASPPTVTTGDQYVAWVETGRTYNDVTAVVTGSSTLTLCCSVTNVNSGHVYFLGAGVGGYIGWNYQGASGVGGSGSLVGTPAFPFTLRCYVTSAGVFNVVVGGSTYSYNLAANDPTAWSQLQGATKIGFKVGSTADTLDSFQSTDGVWSDAFNRANQQGLGVMDTGQAWSYNP